MSEYPAIPATIRALQKIVWSSSRPVQFVGVMLPPDEMEEVSKLIKANLLKGRVVQEPPNFPQYNLFVERLLPPGTELLVHCDKHWREEFELMPLDRIREASRGRRGDPLTELALAEIERVNTEANAKAEKEKLAEIERQERQHKEALLESQRSNQIAGDANAIAVAANKIAVNANLWAKRAFVVAAFSALVAVGALWYAAEQVSVAKAAQAPAVPSISLPNTTPLFSNPGIPYIPAPPPLSTPPLLRAP